jgi:putative Ca2+/H+ antiporter (TMEM165/GDT1 family)
VLGGDFIARKVPLKLVRICAASSFVVLGAAVLLWG